MRFSNNNEQAQIVSIGHIDLGESSQRVLDIDTHDMPILPTRNVVLFPNVTIPIRLGRETSLRTAELCVNLTHRKMSRRLIRYFTMEWLEK